MERRSRNGRPRKSIAHQARQMEKIVKVDPRKTTVNVTNYANKQLGISVGIHTASKRLREANLLARRPTKKPLISKVNKKKSGLTLLDGICIGHKSSEPKFCRATIKV